MFGVYFVSQHPYVNVANPHNSVSKPDFSTASAEFDQLCQIVARLRAPGGCPWDREQTNELILPQLIEEAYELLGAARSKDLDNFREELGDLLLHIVMHAEITREAGKFDIANVIQEVSEKLVRRHPHVFGQSK